ncbi:MAG: TraB/GumN family protein [Oscillospiraceae bacterium]|nr:TraB/GumN family protein [Oscillospiraceae bacterium]
MKRLLALLLALSMLFTFAACGSETEADEPVVPAAVTPEADEDPAAPSEPEPAAPSHDDHENHDDFFIEPSDATPLMWLVTAPDGQTMYLFGSMHAGEPSLYPLSDTIMDAFYAADYLAVEVDLLAFYSDFDAQEAVAAMIEYEEGMTIVDEIGEELYIKAIDALLGLGLGLTLEDLEGLEMFKPYVWWSDIFTSLALEFSGLSPFFGIDFYFLMEAEEHGIEILEVESLLAQMETLLGFSTPLQMYMLEETLDIELMIEGLLQLYETFRYGDLEMVTAMREATLTEMPAEIAEEYYNGLMINRDIVMADAIEQYFAEEKNVFYIVGLLHMVGENGIIDLLTQRGYEVELVEIN